MYKQAVMSAVIIFFAGVSYASAATTQADTPKNCLEEDRGYKLINADGTIEPVRLYGAAVKKISASSLNGNTSAQLRQFGVTTGDPREWARLFVMLCKQESNCRIARTNPDGSLQKFPTTPAGERSYGPLQFNIGEYGLTSWAMVNSPSCTLEAFIRVAQQNKLLSYFGSMQRPNETLQHASWFNTTVKPFADALTLVFDPNAPNNSATYRALTPYFSDPSNTSYGPSTPMYGSPFSANPFSPVSATPYSAQGAHATPGASPSGTTSQTPLATQQPAGSPLSISVQTTQTAGATEFVNNGRSASMILVRPSAATQGKTVIIAWTSVNMQPASCSVKVNSADFATGNEATKSYTVSDSGSGEIVFALRCLGANNQVHESTSVVTIK